MTNQQYFLIRRLHSLLGVIPLGFFLFGHLTTNFMALFGEKAFVDKVKLIHSLGPLLPFVEAGVIFIPLALHIVIGIYIALQAKNNTNDLGYGRNWAFALQRWSGWIALAFLVYHTVTLRFLDTANTQMYGVEAFYRHLSVLFRNPFFFGIYLIGGASVIYHFANGLCTFCMTWGITVSQSSQKWMVYIAIGVGVILMTMLVGSMAGFVLRYEPIFSEPGMGLTPLK